MSERNSQTTITPEKLFRGRVAIGRAVDRMIPDGSIFVDAFGDVPDYICAVSTPLRIVNDRSGRVRRLASRIDEVRSIPVLNGSCSCRKVKLSESAKCHDGLYGTTDSISQDLMSARLATASRIGRPAAKSTSVDESVKFVLETSDVIDVDPVVVHRLVPKVGVVIWYDPTIWLTESSSRPGRLLKRLLRLRVPALVRCTGSPVFQTMLSEAGWWLTIIESQFECVFCGCNSRVLEIVACNRAYQEV